MPFISPYTHDAFVSYAHIDDEPLSGAEHGWVTTLVKNLETVVRQKLGFKDFGIWMDRELAGNQPLTPAIMEALARTAVLLIILSPGYLASDWCRRERQSFLKLVQSRRDRGCQVFVIHFDKLERDSVPAEIADLIGYQFWKQAKGSEAPRPLGIPVPSPSETEYYNRVNQLGYELSLELKRLQAISADRPEFPGRTAIFLTEVTDDLDTRREDVKRYLSQAGFDVLPQVYYPRDDPDSFTRAMRRDLARCKVFVQLLSIYSGRKSPNAPDGYPVLQYQLAQSAQLPILQWRDRNLDGMEVENASQNILLQLQTVRACGIEDFKEAIVLEARRPVAPLLRAAPKNVLVFVNSDSADRDLAERVADLLLKEEIGCSMPVASEDPEEIRIDLQENLLTCDGLLIVYGASSAIWVRRQLMQCRKILAQRQQPLSAMAIFEGPPREKAEIDLMLPHLLRLNCREGLGSTAVVPFLTALKH
jgi:hypothetical protein